MSGTGNGSLNVQVTALNTLNDPTLATDDYKREASIDFSNPDGISLESQSITVTQYAPVLRYDAAATATGANPVPADGTVIPPVAATFTIHADYNVGWGVKVYIGTSTTATATMAFPGNGMIVSAAPAVDGSVTVTIPTYNSFDTPRNVFIYLYATDTKLTNGRNHATLPEILVASLVQASNTPLAAPGVIGYIKGTNTLTLAGSKEYKDTAVDNGSLSDQTVYVAYFKWGSLIATGSEGGNGDVFDKNDVIAVPQEYRGNTTPADALATMKGEIGGNTAGTAWVLVPYNPNTTWPNSPADNAAGHGNPCTYYFGGDGWRMPTTVSYSWHQDGGSPFGSSSGSINWTSNPGNKAVYADNTKTGYTDLPMSGAVAGNGSGGQN